jgi:hypothetical protein
MYIHIYTGLFQIVYVYIYVVVSALEMNPDDSLPKEGDKFVTIHIYVYRCKFMYMNICIFENSYM